MKLKNQCHVIKGKPAPMVELQGVHRDGHQVWLQMDKTSRQLENENDVTLLLLHDVTAEASLREAEVITAAFENFPEVFSARTIK